MNAVSKSIGTLNPRIVWCGVKIDYARGICAFGVNGVTTPPLTFEVGNNPAPLRYRA